MAERLDAQAAALIAEAQASRTVTVDVHGARETAESRFSIVALDESREGDEPPPPVLTEPLAFTIDLDAAGEPDDALERKRRPAASWPRAISIPMSRPMRRWSRRCAPPRWRSVSGRCGRGRWRLPPPRARRL